MSDEAQALIDATREAAGARPDHIYEMAHGPCAYVHQGAPSCLIGQAAWKLGLIDNDLEDLPVNTNGASGLLEFLSIEATNRQVDWLETVQGAQDNGSPWGEAINDADEAYPLP